MAVSNIMTKKKVRWSCTSTSKSDKMPFSENILTTIKNKYNSNKELITRAFGLDTRLPMSLLENGLSLIITKFPYSFRKSSRTSEYCDCHRIVIMFNLLSSWK